MPFILFFLYLWGFFLIFVRSINNCFAMKRFYTRIIILFLAAVLAFNNRLYAAAQTISFTVNGVTFNMVVVEGGTFTMGATSEQGSDATDLENPAHQVTLSTYLIGQTEVTQELWQAVRGSNPAQHTGNLQYPVERVSWQDCFFFINNLNQLLPGYIFDFPTEAQWEYAARGGKYSNGYKYSGSNTVGNVAWYSGNSGYNAGSYEPIFPVAKKAPNELGIYDMSGNVDEWVLDRYGPYSSSPQTDPSGPSATNDQPSYRVVRGGNVGTGATCCRVSYRNQTLTRQDEISSTRGFRLACKYQMATGVSLNNTSATLNTGQTLQLTATVTPSTAMNKNVTWKSSNTNVATVSSSGLVTAKGPGTATITVTTADGSNKSATCTITVIQLATGVSLNKSSATLNTGQTLQLTATVTPSNTSNKNVTWKSSNTTVATVSSSGLVTAKAPGSATITVTTADGSNKSATCALTVKQLATGVSLNKTSATLNTGQTLQLTATVTPSNTSNKNVTWTSSNTTVATVSSSGLVTAKSAGTATITVTTADGSNKSATCAITVKQLVTGITLNKSALYMVEDDEFTLVATVTPSNANNKNVTWSSTDPNIASVNNGVVTAYGVGECVIKATTVDGSNLSASCNVTVADKTMSPRNNYLEADNLPDLLVGEPIVIPVRLVNAASITGLQADLLLPSGFTLDSRAVTLDASRNGGDHSVTTTTTSNGIHITVASPTSKAFKGQGTLMYLRLKAAREIGKYNIDLNNITLTTPSAFVIEPADVRIQAMVRNFRWGDVNGDGVADGNDLNMLINIVLGKISANDSVVKGDPNIDGEGNIDGSDINMLINILLGK